MSWFDLIHSGLLHQPDAESEAKRFLDQKAADNAAAVAGGAGPVAAADIPSPAATAVAAGPPIGIAKPGPAEAQAYQTPQSWGSIMLDLSRQNQQEQQFNRSLGGMLATLSQPANRERVAHTFDTTPMDPLQFGKTAMDLGVQQQGQDRVNQIAALVNDPVQGPELARKMGIDWGLLKTGILTDPNMIGKVAETMATPTSGQREFAAAQAAIEKQVRAENPTWNDDQVRAEVNRQVPPSMLVSGAGFGSLEDQSYRKYAADERAAGRAPLDPVAWKEHSKNITETKDEAVAKWPGLSARIDETNTVIDRIKNNPKLDEALTYMTTFGAAGADKAVKLHAIDQKTYDAIQDIQLLSGQVYSEGFNASGTRRTQAEVAAIVSGLSQLQATGKSASSYIDTVLKPLQGHMQRARDIAREQAGIPAEEAAPTPPKEEPKVPKYNRKTGEFE
jgi:hypothetical protein